ncbi:MAG: GDP-mannose 4,6-dehydratase [Kiritimatiellae bacterium]|nr:GDP-mannose 4,6-dehydratase [Kiritimatiellia bacterium]
MPDRKPRHTITRALITGVTGSGGSYMAEYLVQNEPNVAVHGISRWHSNTSQSNLAAVADRVTVHECDLTDFSAVLSVLRDVRPDGIFHLASHANVRASFINPLAVLQNNIMGTANLLEAVRQAELDPVIQLCSTSEVYGQVNPDEVPITEDQPIRASSPYAVSKVAQDLLGFTYFRSYGMKIVRTRMFAYLNPKRADLFATSFARQVARIEAGLQKELAHGNLDSVRTLIDVRDAMAAYWLAALYGEPGEVYNIGGPTTLSVGEFLEKLRARSTVEIPTYEDPQLLRPADVTLQIPCVDKFVNVTGWQPQYAFKDSVDHLLEYWRDRVRREAVP